MAGRNKALVRYAGRPILFRGLMTCEHCGCSVTGEKKKYIYYSYKYGKIGNEVILLLYGGNKGFQRDLLKQRSI
jgi:hypothetical protein